MRAILFTQLFLSSLLYPLGLLAASEDVPRQNTPLFPISGNGSTIAPSDTGAGTGVTSGSTPSSTLGISTSLAGSGLDESTLALTPNSTSFKNTTSPQSSLTVVNSSPSTAVPNSQSTNIADISSSLDQHTTLLSSDKSESSTGELSQTTDDQSKSGIATLLPAPSNITTNIGGSVPLMPTDISTGQESVGPVPTVPHPSSTRNEISFPVPTDSRTEGPTGISSILLPPGITLPPNPTITLYPSDSEFKSSASDMSVVIAGLFPLLQNWLDHPDPPQVTGIINGVENILPKATDLLGKLPKPTDGVEPCKSGQRRRNTEMLSPVHPMEKRFLGGLFKTAFSLMTCAINTVNKVEDGVTKGTTDIVKSLVDDLKPMVDALNDLEPDDDPDDPDDEQPESSAEKTERPTSTRPESSSSSSCSVNTISNCNIACTIVATTTIGGARRRADDESCVTTCGAPITKCDATGVTSTSTIISTTTAVRKCAKGCSRCNGPEPQPQPITNGNYLTDSNGLAYLPAPTVSVLTSIDDFVERGLEARVTDLLNDEISKRKLPDPKYRPNKQTYGQWMLEMFHQPGGKRLDHGDLPDWRSTSLTDPLLDERGSWNLGNLHGCTAIVVVSRKRIYIAHIWEDPTMDNTDKDPQGGFQRDALDVFMNPNGDGKGVLQGISAFTGPGGDFHDPLENQVRAMIITPVDPDNSDPQHDDLKYPTQVRRMKDMLNNVLGNDKMLPVNHIPYEDRDEDPEHEQTHAKLVIQYDPIQAMEESAGGNCPPTQMAALEVRFDDVFEKPQYSDLWAALPRQIPQQAPGAAARMAVGVSAPSGSSSLRRFIRGQEITSADEDEWLFYANMFKRQGGVCQIPTGTASVPSTGEQSTTLSTSFVTSSRSNDGMISSTQDESVLSSGTTYTALPTATLISSGEESTSSKTFSPSPTDIKESHSTGSKTPPEPTPAPPIPSPKSKAPSIVLNDVATDDEQYNSWVFFETKVGVQADICSDPVLDDEKSRWYDEDAIANPPWPHGTFVMKLFGEDDCEYLNDGNGSGILYCPSFGDDNSVSCKEDSEKGMVLIEQCLYSPQISRARHRVAYCEW